MGLHKFVHNARSKQAQWDATPMDAATSTVGWSGCGGAKMPRQCCCLRRHTAHLAKKTWRLECLREFVRIDVWLEAEGPFNFGDRLSIWIASGVQASGSADTLVNTNIFFALIFEHDLAGDVDVDRGVRSRGALVGNVGKLGLVVLAEQDVVEVQFRMNALHL